MLKKGNLLLIFVIGLLMMPIMVYGKENTEKTEVFDQAFSKNEYTINTDMELKNDADLSSIVKTSLGNLTSEYNYNTANVYVSNVSCHFSEMKCDFTISERVIDSNNSVNYNEVKKYQDINIKINSKIDEYFSMVKDNKMVINYDEKTFSSESEKMTYISDYVQSFNKNTITEKAYYNFYQKYIIRYKSWDELDTIYIKRVDTVVFDFKETDYSDEFKKLTTDGKVVINTNLELSDRIVSTYLYDKYSGFYKSSNLKDNKAYIKRGHEIHLVEFSVKNDIDTSLFEIVKNGKIDVPTTKFENSYDLYEYLTTVLDVHNDDHNKMVTATTLNDKTDSIVLKAEKYDKNHSVESVQYYNVGINYTGYSNNYSDKFKKDLGTKLVINSDEKDQYIVSRNIGYQYKVISCSNDYSSCVITLSNRDNKTVEVHNVAVEFSNTPSAHFKEVFKIKEDRTVDILTDNTTKDEFYIYLNEFDKASGDKLMYSCNLRYTDKKLSCSLKLENDKTRIYEQHEINANLVKTEKSEEFKKIVVDSKVVYPGELTNLDYVLSSSDFHKNGDTSRIHVRNCSSEKGGCDVIIRNSSNSLEKHFIPVEIKEGKSKEFSELFPGDTIEVPIVFKDNTNYINDAFYTYMLNKTKKEIRLKDYKDGKALVNWDDKEAHTYNIKFAEEDKEKAQIVDEITQKVEEKKINVDVEDLDLVNMLYYGENYSHNGNVKTKSLDNAVNEVVSNKHISYSLIPGNYFGGPSELGRSTRASSGPMYEISWGGPMIFYYDGIAYNFTKEPVIVNYKYVLYIPSDTNDTVEDYIKAAQKKIDDYLGADSGVVVKYNGPAADEALDVLSWDLTNCDKNEYTLSYNDNSIDVLIIKDSNKITKPEFIANDIINNVVIKAENVSYPTDTIVSTEMMKEDTEEFKAILKTIKADTAQVFDISLYSPSVGAIKDFNKGAVFKVTVPLTNEKLKDKKLVAYYLDDEGNIVSEHPVVVENGMATFETTHFSTYVIAEKKESILPELPNTVDAIFYFVGIAVIALLGMKLSKKYMIKKN